MYIYRCYHYIYIYIYINIIERVCYNVLINIGGCMRNHIREQKNYSKFTHTYTPIHMHHYFYFFFVVNLVFK